MSGVSFDIPRRILSVLADKIDDFYLVGGTALSMIYFQHRESYDVDFFTQDFHKDRVVHIIEDIRNHLKASVTLDAEQLKDGRAKMVVYMVSFADGKVCKVDFVEDFSNILEPLSKINGIKVLSLDDIYQRKIFAVAGHVKAQDAIGRDIMIGGRQEAKDFYDLYCLSTIKKPLSKFIQLLRNTALQEGLINWFRTYDRMTMKTGILELITSQSLDHRQMEKHFEMEINKILENMIRGD